MKQLFLFLLIFFSVCARAQAQEVYGHEEKADITARQDVSTARAYNNKGEHVSTTTTTGNLSTTETMTYDEWGRLTALTSSTGAERTYQYGNRTTTETIAGQSPHCKRILSRLRHTQRKAVLLQDSEAIGS